MTWTRRQLLELGGAAIVAGSLPALAESAAPAEAVLKPKRLKKGDLGFGPDSATTSWTVTATWPGGTRIAPPT